VNVCASRRHKFVSLSWSLRLSPCWRYWEDWLDLILFETTLAGLVFSEVCYRIKWGEKNRSKNKALDGHNMERNASPFWPLFIFVSRTARQEAESLWDRPVLRVFKWSKQLPIIKGRSLCLCDNYWVKYRYDPVTNLTVWPILIAWWHVYEHDGRVGCVTYSYTDDMKGECMYK